MQFYDLATTTLGAPSKPVELKIPLWWSDGNIFISSTSTTAQYVKDGTGTPSSTPVSLHTLSANWPASTKFAFEVTTINGNANAYITLYDVAASSMVSSSQVVNGNSQTMRSGQFALTPGHSYGVQAYVGTSGYGYYIVDVSIIVFPN